MDNNVILAGKIQTKFTIDYETDYEKFYHFVLMVERESGISDEIPIVVSERLINPDEDCTGRFVLIKGRFIAHFASQRLKMFVAPDMIEFINAQMNLNQIQLVGRVCKVPKLRKTPQGRSISDLLVAVEGIDTEFIPCIAWGYDAEESPNYKIGSRIAIDGRIQSRDYLKDYELKTAYEVSINNMGMR